jgi:hypothetical protein
MLDFFKKSVTLKSKQERYAVGMVFCRKKNQLNFADTFEGCVAIKICR